MSLSYLEDLEGIIDRGGEYYICQGIQSSEWSMSKSIDTVRKKAQRAADVLKMPVPVYRMISKSDTVSGDSYICVRRILEPGPHEEARFQWAIVDTKEAAEMMRDVSQGPSPYFGVSIEETMEPAEDREQAKNPFKPKGR